MIYVCEIGKRNTQEGWAFYASLSYDKAFSKIKESAQKNSHPLLLESANLWFQGDRYFIIRCFEE
jgi:hypothetical protein